MPNLITTPSRRRMGLRGYSNAKELAAAIGFPHSRVRNGVGGSDVISWATVYAIARALKSDDETLDDVIADIVANNEGVPDEPPPQPKPKRTGPTRRQERETDNRRTGPRRAQGRAA